MAFPLAAIGIGAGASILGDLLGGGGSGPQIPDWLEALLRDEIAQVRSDDYSGAGEGIRAKAQAQIDQILSQLPIAQENFEADLARRGISGAAEGTTRLYRDVYAPIAQSAATVGAGAEFEAAQFELNARQRQQQLINQLLQIALGGVPQQPAGSRFGRALGGTLSNFGDFGTTYGFAKALNLV